MLGFCLGSLGLLWASRVEASKTLLRRLLKAFGSVGVVRSRDEISTLNTHKKNAQKAQKTLHQILDSKF